VRANRKSFAPRCVGQSGVITPIVTGLSGPGSMAFVDTIKHSTQWSDSSQEDGGSCFDRGGDSQDGSDSHDQAQLASGG
jgi:hypothetical protein